MTRKPTSTDPRTENLFQKLEKVTRQMSSRAAPEAVHQLRTTVRRIETLISTHSLTEHQSITKLAKQLATLRRRAGKVRDLDVQLTALRSIRLDGGGRDKTVLARHLTTVRSKREKKLLGTLQDEIDGGLRKRMQRGVKLLEKQSEAAPQKDFTADALRKFQELAESYPPLTEENLHPFRMECKRIRYLSEMSGETREAVRVVAALKHIQDAIGEWHDWLTLTEAADEVLANPASPLLAALRANRRYKFNEALRAVADVKRQLLSKPDLMEREAAGRASQPGTEDATTAGRSPSRKQAQRAVEPGVKSTSAAVG